MSDRIIEGKEPMDPKEEMAKIQSVKTEKIKPDEEKPEEVNPQEEAPEGEASDGPAPDGGDPDDAEEKTARSEEKWKSGVYTSPVRKGHPGKRNRKHRRKNWLLRLIIAAGVIVVFVMVANLPYFQITETPVIGNRTVSDEEILKLSGIQSGDSILLLNTLSIKGKIKENLFIEDVRVNRELPTTVEIIVKEREAAAQFLKTDKNGRKTYIVTDINGMVMGLSAERQKVTMVDDVTVTDAAKGSRVKVKETGTYRKAMELILTAQQGDLYFKRIQIQGSLVRAWIFSGLVCKGRFQNVIHGITSGELKAVVYRLYQEDVDEGTINIGENNYCSFTPK